MATRLPKTSSQTRWPRIVGHNIWRERISAELTQSELAEAVRRRGVPLHPDSLGRLERGATSQGFLPSISVDQLMAVADALGVSVHDLLNEEAWNARKQ